MKALLRTMTTPSSPNSPSSSSPSPSPSPSSSWSHLRSVLFVATSSPHSSSSSDRSSRLKSPWSRHRRKQVLSSEQWKGLFTSDGRLQHGGIKFLKRVRSRGVDPSIRQEVWPFLLGVYDLNSSGEERDSIKTLNRKKYEKLRKVCWQFPKHGNRSFKLSEIDVPCQSGCCGSTSQERDTYSSEDAVTEEGNPAAEHSDEPSSELLEGDDSLRRIKNVGRSAEHSESSDSDSSEDLEVIRCSLLSESSMENDPGMNSEKDASPSSTDALPKDSKLQEVIRGSLLSESSMENDPGMSSEKDASPSSTDALPKDSKLRVPEDFSTWQRIIHLDALRASADWVSYSPSQASVCDARARSSAEAVGLKDYDNLEPCRILHAARLVSILEAYAIYDPEIGYCQGMSDLLSPILTVISEDHEAFWCFVGFMKKARHNFRLDEVGIRRQLNIVAKIIKSKDSHLYRHLEKLQAEDCFFVYRMVVVLFRRELKFEQTVSLWEVMWADQAAIRAGIGKSAWSRIRQRAPPTDDLLLYAVAASVLQRKKLIIEKYSSMDEILSECNSMEGQLDVWKLLDDAHNLVVTLHDKIKTS